MRISSYQYKQVILRYKPYATLTFLNLKIYIRDYKSPRRRRIQGAQTFPKNIRCVETSVYPPYLAKVYFRSSMPERCKLCIRNSEYAKKQTNVALFECVIVDAHSGSLNAFLERLRKLACSIFGIYRKYLNARKTYIRISYFCKLADLYPRLLQRKAEL